MTIPLVGAPRGLKAILLPISFFIMILVLLAMYSGTESEAEFFRKLSTINVGKINENNRHRPTNTHAPPKYKPTPTLAVSTVTDPFPLLASSTATPPPIPEYNIPRPGLHREYGLSYLPPLFIGFTRQWPMLLQCVTSYITAGWPPESIFVVENTGVQNSNANGKLTLQNPFYLNHTTLHRLGVNVLQTPVLLSFSQMQNFFLSTAHARDWPYYFYSHQDVLVFSFEDGADDLERPGDREWFYYDDEDELDMTRPPAAGELGYRTIYENCLRELNRTIEREERWGFRWFQYDHLTLVNRAALDAVGGWDSLMPYYGSDCDMNARLEMDGWSMRHRRIGIINDVSTVMENLAALYRDPRVRPRFVDPNPVPEAELEQIEQTTSGATNDPAPDDQAPDDQAPDDQATQKRGERRRSTTAGSRGGTTKSGSSNSVSLAKSLDYFRALVKVVDYMGIYKYRSDNYARNSWQTSQHGGAGEPYHYDADGFATSFWILAEAGREVFRQKWGHRDCDLVAETALKLDDQWKVEKDWED
ncbi:hypothetical protein F5X96DRAFT_459230 [Biscogniauxia mediterranea]|nr:hypothetical protein F5X96DRAFT_459230 [Biscogniauxia mediterranea]